MSNVAGAQKELVLLHDVKTMMPSGEEYVSKCIWLTDSNQELQSGSILDLGVTGTISDIQN